MKIFNIMMSRKLGGIEQAFLDYDKALTLENHQVFNITSVNAQINKYLNHSITLPNLFSWCFFSKIYLKLLILIHKPDIIIAHGGRAINFSRTFKPKALPLIGVTHHYAYKHLKFCDYVIAITEDLQKYMHSNSFDSAKTCLIPNMIEVRRPYTKRNFKSVPVIGAFGRFVAKKGFDDFIKAIAILKKRGVKIKALLGGDGLEADLLKKLATENDLEDTLFFIGWIKDKASFFNEIDIFCLPSLHEPFGIVLLEAMEHSVPIVATKSEGPSQILRPATDALLTDLASPEDLADTLSELINNHGKATNLSFSAYLRLTENYGIDIVSKKLSKFLNKIVGINEL